MASPKGNCKTDSKVVYTSTALTGNDRKQLDTLVVELGSDRSTILREALRQYLASFQSQMSA